ncbi:hypothetical protein DEA8626_00109 [Defluviimonas aquaemixtae]|uniref:DUF306 domain-containing protein n=1 Tax=Albidovulum aquaemixtae TaxID=1542388 RepID=A0A2R8B1U9_9RHOB|nr:META domain-containing protein [Defluviimonas aquaemixtae]SPH16599.1 hypothetical protein DEA8626_00109 [Defluviimonas aquaemixtae]
MCLSPLCLALSATLGACAGDETLSGHGAREGTWRLSELDGAAFEARATLGFPAPGRISGDGPCNAFNGTQGAPYPWFQAEMLLSTRRACPDLQAENAYFRALTEMTLAEVQDDILILSNTDGREMVFQREAADQP